MERRIRPPPSLYSELSFNRYRPDQTIKIGSSPSKIAQPYPPATLRASRNSPEYPAAKKRAGMKISLRMKLTNHNVENLDGIFKFVENEDIERVCFYHLAYSGRGKKISSDDCSLEETRQAVDFILEKTKELHNKGIKKDILTVDNHADGIYIYLKLLSENNNRAEQVKQLLEWNGGGANSSGVGIGNIDFVGNVHADQFWMDYSFGNVRERKFSEIWQDTSDPLMAGLKNRLSLLKGRCGKCKWKKMCGGSLRVRAKFVHNDPWAEDPACYLTDEEIGL